MALASKTALISAGSTGMGSLPPTVWRRLTATLGFGFPIVHPVGYGGDEIVTVYRRRKVNPAYRRAYRNAFGAAGGARVDS